MRLRSTIVLVAGAIMGYQLFCDPIVGLANNGDFVRVLAAYRLVPDCEAGHDCYFKYVTTRYRFEPNLGFGLDQFTSELITMVPALAVNWFLSKDGYFDLRVIGFIHAALWLSGLWWLMPLFERWTKWRRRIMGALLLLVFTDFVYVQYSNTFYKDAETVIYSFLMFVFLLRLAAGLGKPFLNGAGLAVTLAMALMAKAQHMLLFLPVLGFLFLFRRRYWPHSPRSLYAFLTLMLVALVALAVTVPRAQKVVSFYNIVFSGILPDAPDRNEALKELGLPAWYSQFSGSHAYSENAAMNAYAEDLEKRASQRTLIGYYFRHPGAALALLLRGLPDAGRQRVPGYGNFPKESGLPERMPTRAFAVWSNVKETIFQDRPGAVVSYFVLSGLALVTGTIRRWGNRADLPALALLGWGMAAMAYAISTLADVLDTTRHLYVYTFLTDVIFLAAAGVWLHQQRVLKD